MIRRGELYRVARPGKSDPRAHRLFCVVSRQALIDSKYSTVICAPVYSANDGLSTQVSLGLEDGVKKNCAIHCDNLVSLPKAKLTNFVATLLPAKLLLLNEALTAALALDE